jgi:hypothetical protein
VSVNFKMSSYTVSVVGNSSTLKSTLFPALRLQKGKLWEAALLDLTTYNSIPNITEGINNKIHYYKTKDKDGTYSSMEELSLPTGSYEIDNINEVVQKYMGKENITISGNNNTMKTEIVSKYYIDFTQNHSIGELLGFSRKTGILEANKTHIGDKTVTILKVNTIDITCNIIHGSYRNGENKHILHTFYPSVPPGFKLIERPQNLVYLPLNTSYVSDIVLDILDQEGNLVDFRGEPITVRLHIKSTK